jgi:Na+-driven multidrug efflux pump
MKFSMLFSLILGTLLTIVCYIFTDSTVGAFLTQESAFDHAVRFFHILLSTAFFLGVYVCYTNALQAMGVTVSVLVVNVSRQGLIYIPLLFGRSPYPT